MNADAALQYDKETGLFDVVRRGVAAWPAACTAGSGIRRGTLLTERGYVADNLMAEAEKQFLALFHQEPDLKRARRISKTT